MRWLLRAFKSEKGLLPDPTLRRFFEKLVMKRGKLTTALYHTDAQATNIHYETDLKTDE